MPELFAPVEPYDVGILDVGDGHSVYWELSGDPDGIPAIVLHGGPGSGCSENSRRYFDPARFRILLFDQWGCGRSRPLADEPDADLEANTTQHLIADIERLRALHGVDQWSILGLSWGTTLGLAYAQAHRECVRSLVLVSATTGSRKEIEWITEGVGMIFPREWERFTTAVPPSLRSMRPVDAYAVLLFDPDPAVRETAATEWCAWEDAHVSLAPGNQPNPRFEDPAFRLRFARLVTHYWSHDCFLGEDGVLLNAGTLNGIPGAMIHGRYDVSSPLQTIWELSKRWTSSTLSVIDDAGHRGSDAFRDAFMDALKAANSS